MILSREITVKYVFVFLFLWQAGVLYAQPGGQSARVGPNCISGEWYGNGVYYSVNYERIIYSTFTNKFKLGLRVGGMAYPNVFFPGKPLFIFPVELNAITGRTSSKIEFSIGNSFATEKFYHWATNPQRYYNQFILTTRFGYRLYTKEGIVFRIGILPLFTYKLGYVPETNESNFGILKPSTSNLVNDKIVRRYALGISAGMSFGYSF